MTAAAAAEEEEEPARDLVAAVVGGLGSPQSLTSRYPVWTAAAEAAEAAAGVEA